MTFRTAPVPLPDPVRRATLKALGAGAVALTAPALLRPGAARAQAAPFITKAIPRTGEMLPAIGLGTFMVFDIKPGQPRDHLKEVLRRFHEAGGRVVDTSPLYGMAEVSVGDFATSLNIGKDLFITNKTWATGDWLGHDGQALSQLRTSMERLWRSQIDVMQCHSLVNVPVIVNILRGWKKEGRIRYLGVTHHELPYFGPLAQWVERGDLEFVQVHYSIHTRLAEERILPAAMDKGTAVLVNMPFEKARLFKIVEGRPLPDFAREIGCENWAQFFLKWVIAHPAVTAAIPATSNPEHMSQNMGSLRGPLPDAAMRARMVKHMETIPGFDKLAEMKPYPDKTFVGVVQLPGR